LDVARAFVEDMRASFAKPSALKRDKITAASFIFATADAPDEWFAEHDPEGVVFEYPVIE
jgi:hypothetical protein